SAASVGRRSARGSPATPITSGSSTGSSSTTRSRRPVSRPGTSWRPSRPPPGRSGPGRGGGSRAPSGRPRRSPTSTSPGCPTAGSPRTTATRSPPPSSAASTPRARPPPTARSSLRRPVPTGVLPRHHEKLEPVRHRPLQPDVDQRRIGRDDDPVLLHPRRVEDVDRAVERANRFHHPLPTELGRHQIGLGGEASFSHPRELADPASQILGIGRRIDAQARGSTGRYRRVVSKVPTSPALALFALAALLALLVAGCGGGSSSSAGSSTSAAAPSKGSSSSTGSKAGASTATQEGPETAPAIPLEPGYADWPYFGRVPQRTHYLPANRGVVDRPLDPPLRQAWSINTHALIEFPPAIGGGVAYAINKYGNGKAIELGTRKIVGELSLDPKNKGHQEIVTGPAYYRGDVYGALAAGNGKTGKTVWERHLHAHLESSPLPVDGNLYLGTDTAEVLALDAGDGHTVWTFKAPGAIKASPSYDAGKVFVADYESSMYALEANTGKPVWRTNTSKVA